MFCRSIAGLIAEWSEIICTDRRAHRIFEQKGGPRRPLTGLRKWKSFSGTDEMGCPDYSLPKNAKVF
jgi:hypothetical protein